MLRVGFAAGRGSPGDRLRWWGLFAAAAALALVALGTVAISATYDGREARNQARGPFLTHSAKGADTLFRATWDTVGDVQHQVLYVHPLRADASLPPGLDAWPRPGEAVLSPELLRAGAAEKVRSRYGTFGGRIAKSGLVAPSERLAYVRPAEAPDPRSDAWTPTLGHGLGMPTGEMMHQRAQSGAQLALWGLVGVPAVVLVLTAARIGSRTRDRRSGLLQALGGTWWHRALINLGEALLPVSCGTLTAWAPWAVAASWDLRLGPTGYVLNSTDIRTTWEWAAIGLGLSFVLTLATVVVTHRVGRDGRSTRPRSFTSAVPRWRVVAWCCGVALILSSQYVPRRSGLFAFCVGTVAMWVFLPSVTALIARRLGAVVARRGARKGRVGQIIGGRWTRAHPGVVVRLSLAMVVGLGLIAQLQVWNSRLSASAAAASHTRSLIGDTVVEVGTGPLSEAETRTFGEALPPEAMLLKRTADGKEIRLQGSCPALRSLSLGCPQTARPQSGGDTRVTELRRWSGALAFQATDRFDVHEGEGLVVVTSRTGQLAEIKAAAYALPEVYEVGPLGDTWLGGAKSRERLTNWTTFFGAWGLGFLLVTGALGAAAEFGRVRSALSPLTVLTGATGVYRSVGRWHLTLPLLIAALGALLMISWHSVFFVAVVEEGAVSWGTLATGVTGCVLIAVLIGELATRSAIRAARTWRPTAD